MTLSKLLVLKDRATREDYFAQQAAFVMMEGRKDVHAVSVLVCSWKMRLREIHLIYLLPNN